MAPSKASGGRYQRVTTSEEYVWLGIDFARARPGQREKAQNSLSYDFLESQEEMHATKELITGRVSNVKKKIHKIWMLLVVTPLS